MSEFSKEWCGPFSFEEIIASNRKSIFSGSGVYVWMQYFQKANKQYITYVGKSQDIQKRHYEHHANYLSGRYRIELDPPRSDKVYFLPNLLRKNVRMPRAQQVSYPYIHFCYEQFKIVLDRIFKDISYTKI